jgi:NAD(P)-dependent dehydrogenase (short-subunit alcohol dehydrogenase family)
MNSISFAGRVVIITGAGGGIGRSHALEIGRRGGAVVVNDLGSDVAGHHHSFAVAEQVAAEIRAAGGRAVANHENVATRHGAANLIATALTSFGRVDAVINNAGIMRNSYFNDFTDDDMDALFATHLRGSWLVTHAAWPHMQEQEYGRVVFTSSSAGMFGSEMQAAYGAAKAGVTGLMNVLALEGAEHGINCNALMPNAAGRMADQYVKDIGPGETHTDPKRVAAMASSMTPSFNTGLAVYLASEACTTTHAIYSSCGGRIARVFVGVAAGWQGSRDQPASADDIATHFAEINDLTRGFHTPVTSRDEWRLVLSAGPLTR